MRTTGVTVLLQSLQVVVSLVNLSVSKSADMSTSQYSDKWLADEAVDGDVSQDVQDNSCAVTKYGITPEAWWRVDLGDVYVINSVRIYNRRENPSVTYRLSGFSLYVADSPDWDNGNLCYQHSNGGTANPGPSDVLTVQCNATGRYVTVYKQRKNVCFSPSLPQYCAQLELCEVQVFGCTHGTYGYSCQYNCSGNCRNGEMCSKDHGGCDNGCVRGYKGLRCEQACDPGTYGANCEQDCSQHCSTPGQCCSTNGTCYGGCQSGWLNDNCNKTCEDREFGPGCSEKCSENCIDGFCDVVYGTCRFGCKDGWTGDMCNEGCRRGFYGPNCSITCFGCSESCHHRTGECLVVDTSLSSNNNNAVVIVLIVTNVLTAIALVTAVLLLCRYVRNATHNKPALQTQQSSLNGSGLTANRSGNETTYQPGMTIGNTGNNENRTYEGLQIHITDTNTYEILQTERNVTYIYKFFF